MDDLMLIYQPDGPLFTGLILYGDTKSGERGAAPMLAFEKVSFATMIAHLAGQVSEFIASNQKIGATVRRTDLNQPALRFSEETLLLMHSDPVAVIRSMSPAPTKIFLKRVDPATTSPLRVGYDAIAATFGDELCIRRRVDQVECPCCGRWARTGKEIGKCSELGYVLQCLNRSCGVALPITPRSDRWASVRAEELLLQDVDRFFFPREWNKPGPWITREDLEKKHKDWLKIKKEFS